MKGAVIASDATPDKNKLSTDTLTYSDINNQADYSASSSGYNLDTVTNIKDGGKDASGKQTVVTEKSLSGSPDISTSVNGSASSTSKSGIAQGTIEVRSGNTDLSNLNRNTNDSLNALGKIFDKKTVQEQQELTKVFGQEAYKAIGDLALNQYQKALDDAGHAKKAGNTAAYDQAMARADSWHDGGTNKILLHAVAGGIMSGIGGSGFKSGAVSAGVNEAVQNELAKIKDPGLHQLVSAAIGAVAAKIVGGNAQTGAATAISGTKYNWLDHNQQQAMTEALEAAGNDWEKRREIYTFYAALSQYNIDHYGQRFEAIEAPLLDQLHWDTASTGGGLNLSLNDLTGIYQGYDLANYYRARLEDSNGAYLPSILDHFDYSQSKRNDMQDIYKPSPAPSPETIDSVMNNGGSWNSAGQAVRSDGTVCDNLSSRGDYEYSKTGRIDDYYPDGTAAIVIDGNSYPIYSVPKKQSDNGESGNQEPSGESTRYEGLSPERQKTLNAYDNAPNNSFEKIILGAKFLGQGWAEPIIGYRNSQYQMMVASGMPEELASNAADQITLNFVMPFIGTAIKTGVSGLNSLKQVLSSAPNAYEAGMRLENGRWNFDLQLFASSKKLGDNLVAAGIERPSYPCAAHHIVAGNSPKASEARVILQNFGIDIDEAANGVFLPTAKEVSNSVYHPSLHTDAYYRKVNEMLRSASSKEEAMNILSEISRQLSEGIFMN